jgi:threonine/homoserine/homoserine lactone efflux protein
MPWILAILKGIGGGLLLGLLSFGPSFFALIKVGIQGGKMAGFLMALGIFLSDLLVALACFFGLSGFFTMPEFQIGFAGFAAFGIIFIGVKGIAVGYKKFIKNLQSPIEKNTNLLKGFVMNLLNPFVILLWVTLTGAMSVGHDDSFEGRYTILVQIVATLITVFSLDMGKVYLSDYLGKKLSHRMYFFVNRYFGIILTGLGAYYLYNFIKLIVETTISQVK